MKKYLVKYATIGSQQTEDRFDTIEEAISFCNKKTEGSRPYDGYDLTKNDHYWYEVYDTSIGHWENDQVDDDHIDESSVYTTEYYWI